MEVKNANGTKIARTDYEYDNTSLADTPGVIMYDRGYDPNTPIWCEDCGACIEWTNPGGSWNGKPWTCLFYEGEYQSNANAIYKGNVTKVIKYSDAQNATGSQEENRTYDITGNMLSSSSSCCEITTYEYDDPSTTSIIDTQYAYPVSETRGSSDPNSTIKNTRSAVFDFNTGVINQTTDKNGRIDSTTYDVDTLRPTATTTSTGAYSQTTYDDAAMKITEKGYQSNNALAAEQTKYFNGIGQVIKQEAKGNNNFIDIVETEYSQLGQVVKQTRPFRTGETKRWIETSYDIQGRVKKVEQPDGSYQEAFYNESTRPSSASSVTILPGQTVRVVDAWGRERWGIYNAQGNLSEVVEPKPNGTNGSVSASGNIVTKYTYDELNRLIETEQGVQNRYFKYDDLGRMVRQKLAEKDAALNDAGQYVGVNGTGAQWSDAFFHDSRSNVYLKVDARGVKTNYIYQNNGADDSLNRLQAIGYDTSGPIDTSSVIHNAPSVTYEYMTTGDKSRIKKIRTAGLLTEDFQYDTEGRLKEHKQTVDYRTSYPMTTNYLYDSLNRVDEITYPAQYGLTGSPRKVIKRSYDVGGRVSSLKVNGQEQAGNIVYNAADQMTSIKVGPTGSNQVTETYAYDDVTGFLTNQKVQQGSQTILDLSYEYQRLNSSGSINGKTGHITKILNNLNSNKDREYKYDAVGRLIRAEGGNNIWSQQYTYDRFGNRNTVTATGVAADNTPIPQDGIGSTSYDLSNNQITTSGFQYDSAGNLVRALGPDGATWLKYEYDAANRLQIVKEDDGTTNGKYLQAYQYSSTNSRLMDYNYITNTFILFARDNGVTVAEYNEFISQVPTWTKSYVYLDSSVISTITKAGNSESTEFNHPDRLGTRTVTNQTLGTNYEQTTLPFGTTLNAESTISLNKRFTSYERSSQTGLDYAMNRSYDSNQGRFTQADPIGMSSVDLNNPQTLNLYSYCGNDPINFTDPSGLFWGFFKKLFKAIGKVLSAIGKAISSILSHPVVAIALAVLTAGIGAALSLYATINTALSAYGISTGLAIGVPGALNGISTALSIVNTTTNVGKVLEISGLLFQGKFKQFGKIIGLAFVGALIGVVEDTVRTGFWNGLRQGKPFSGAWKGFKKGLGYVLDSLKRFGTDKWWEGFIPIYGFFCAPGWGLGNSTGGETPIDQLDAACREHDRTLRNAPVSLDRTVSDLRLIYRAATSSVRARIVDAFVPRGFRVGDVYRTTLIFGFSGRVAGRTLGILR